MTVSARIFRNLALLSILFWPSPACADGRDDQEWGGLARLFQDEASLARRSDVPNCAAREAYLAAGLAASSDPGSILLRAGARDVGVIFLAENHRNRPIDLYVRSLEALKTADPALDCLFLEMYGAEQALIDGYLSGGESFERTAAVAREGAARGRSFSFRGDERPLFDAAKRLGLRVIAADASVYTSAQMDADPSLIAKSIKMRNPAMAERISSAFGGGLCRKAVMVLGKAHVLPLVTDRSERGRWPSVLELVRARGLKTFAINVLHREGIEPNYGDELAPKGCSWNLWDRLPAGSAPRGFTPTRPSPAVEQIFNAQDASFSWDDAPLWEEYDGVIVKP